MSCSTLKLINHIVFFCRIPVVLENRRSSQGGGVRTPCTLPLDPPLTKVKVARSSIFVGIPFTFGPLIRQQLGLCFCLVMAVFVKLAFQIAN